MHYVRIFIKTTIIHKYIELEYSNGKDIWISIISEQPARVAYLPYQGGKEYFFVCIYKHIAANEPLIQNTNPKGCILLSLLPLRIHLLQCTPIYVQKNIPNLLDMVSEQLLQVVQKLLKFKYKDIWSLFQLIIFMNNSGFNFICKIMPTSKH